MDTFMGVEIADENRCSPYESSDYSYSQSVEDDIIDAQDGLFSPYTLQCYTSKNETDIEHIVARSEAHDSGLCAASDSTRQSLRSGRAEPHAGAAESQSLREGSTGCGRVATRAQQVLVRTENDLRPAQI